MKQFKKKTKQMCSLYIHFFSLSLLYIPELIIYI